VHHTSLAFEAFRRLRLRTALNMAGVMLAVAVTITTFAVNEGARREALREAERLGLNTVIVRHPRRALTLLDAARLPALLPAIEAVSPAVEAATSIAGPLGIQPARVAGVMSTYGAIRRVAVVDGRFLHAGEDTSGARVCVVAGTLARRLFGYRQPLGGAVRIGRDWYTVVGVLADDGASEVLVPLSAMIAKKPEADPGQRVDAIWIEWPDSTLEKHAGAAIRRAIGLGRAPDDDVEILVARDLAAARDRTQEMFSVVAAVTAAMLFVLGGLAITNAMLTSVLERTPEIGLRRAVGATRRNIVMQFLAESSTVSICGAMTGTLLGLALSAVTGMYSDWPTHVSPAAVVTAFALAILVGVAAGAYPARRAAGIQPIDALMHE